MMNVNVTPDDWEMLSAYLDNQLPPSEKLEIERQLDQRSELRQTYQELRQLKFAFKSLPSKKAPRNYTISPIEKKEKTPIFRLLVPAFGFSSAVAAILLAISIFFQLSPSGNMISQAPEPALMAAEPEALQNGTEPDTQPQIITWGSPGGIGVGGGSGGGGGNGYGIGGGPPAAGVESITPDTAAKIEGSENPVEESVTAGESIIIEKQLPKLAVTPLPVEQNDLITGVRPRRAAWQNPVNPACPTNNFPGISRHAWKVRFYTTSNLAGLPGNIFWINCILPRQKRKNVNQRMIRYCPFCGTSLNNHTYLNGGAYPMHAMRAGIF